MGIFRFRQFEVRNEKSAMKVNTDGVLLGALMTVSGNEWRLLDIGTGTGAIALMAAQRLAEAAAHSRSGHPSMNRHEIRPANRLGKPPEPPKGIPTRTPPGTSSGTSSEISLFIIDAIDIDRASAAEAAENFRDSPWKEHLRAHHRPLSQFRPDAGYDLIFSNPPFFTETLHSPSPRKAQARHADSLPAEEIMAFAAANLSGNGRLSLIVPAEHETEVGRIAAVHGLRLFRTVLIHASDRKKAYRAIMEFSRDAGQIAESSREKVTINMNGKYSEQYLDIVSDFLLLRQPEP